MIKMRNRTRIRLMDEYLDEQQDQEDHGEEGEDHDEGCGGGRSG